jgi:hypothetical protein
VQNTPSATFKHIKAAPINKNQILPIAEKRQELI